jgi:hypothetical protein
MTMKILIATAMLSVVAIPASAAEIIYVGPNGGSGSASVNCAAGYYVGHCHKNWTYTTANGQTWNGQSAAVVGPYWGRGYRTVTTPAGNTFTRGGIWRR